MSDLDPYMRGYWAYLDGRNPARVPTDLTPDDYDHYLRGWRTACEDLSAGLLRDPSRSQGRHT